MPLSVRLLTLLPNLKPLNAFSNESLLSLVDEIDTEEVQNHAPENEVCECSLMRNALEIGLVGRVRLYSQTGCQDELADCC